MNFKAYDILSSLIPGFLALLIFLYMLGFKYDSNLLAAYTAIAFLLGYVMNTLSSWLEGFYFWTWCGKPSNNLLDGKNIWKVKFYHSAQAKQLLLSESHPDACNDELFAICMRYSNSQKDCRIEDFNASYAFSRVLLTTALIATSVILIKNYDDYRYYITTLPILITIWLRCKQKGYYYAKEVLTVYIKMKA